MERNFGMPNPEGYRKALRLMKQAEKFNRPIITFIDTPGAYPGMGAEERGQGEAIARSICEMSNLKVPIICVVIGEGSSGGALAIGVGDRIVMLENAVYSILSPEGFASILYKDSGKAKEAAEKMNEHNITCLPVVEDNGQIVGIITQKVIFGAFIDLMGYYAKGSIVVIDIDKDEPGILQKLVTVTAQHNINITHFIVTRYSGLQIVIRTDETDDMKVTNILTSNGFIVSDHRTNKN